MIFGKTTEESLREFREEFSRQVHLHKVFAWIPTTLESGQTVWLQSYYTKFNGYQREDGTLQAYDQDSVYLNYLEDDGSHCTRGSPDCKCGIPPYYHPHTSLRGA